MSYCLINVCGALGSARGVALLPVALEAVVTPLRCWTPRLSAPERRHGYPLPCTTGPRATLTAQPHPRRSFPASSSR